MFLERDGDLDFLSPKQLSKSQNGVQATGFSNPAVGPRASTERKEDCVCVCVCVRERERERERERD